MTFGTRIFKNGRRRSYLTFDTGKKVILKHAEALEFECKLREVEYTGKLKQQFNGGFDNGR
jgi:hypothetical protein